MAHYGCSCCGEPEQIAAGLTETMRSMLVDIGDGKPREYALGRTGFALCDRGLVFVNELGARHLTDAGQAVRAVLERGDGRGGGEAALLADGGE